MAFPEAPHGAEVDVIAIDAGGRLGVAACHEAGTHGQVHLFRTTDAGRGWARLDVARISPKGAPSLARAGVPIADAVIHRGSIGLMWRDHHASSTYLLVSRDGGESFRQHELPDRSATFANAAGEHLMVFGESGGWEVADAAPRYFQWQVDGGGELDGDVSLHQITFVDRRHALSLVLGPARREMAVGLARSADVGRSWRVERTWQARGSEFFQVRDLIQLSVTMDDHEAYR